MSTYLLFDSCKVVAGYTRSMILDLQRKAYYFVPNASISGIDKDGLICANEENAELIGFLLDEELAFACSPNLAKQFISSKSSAWDYPALISNAIVTCTGFDENYLTSVITQLLDELQCKYLELRFTRPMTPAEILAVAAFMNSHNVLGFSLCVCLHNPGSDVKKLAADLLENERLVKTIVFNYPVNEVIDAGRSNYGNMFFTTSPNLPLSCGLVSSTLFTLHTSHYYESLSHNTCLNRKIAIEADGSIKNCPSMAKSHGNVKTDTLKDVVNTAGFRHVWQLKKDDIAKCRHCEFRHICTDCRAYTDDPSDMRSAPLKCGYNPYTCEWEEWSSNPLKQSAIAYYGMQRLTEKESADFKLSSIV